MKFSSRDCDRVWFSVVPEIGTRFGLSEILQSKKHEAS